MDTIEKFAKLFFDTIPKNCRQANTKRKSQKYLTNHGISIASNYKDEYNECKNKQTGIYNDNDCLDINIYREIVKGNIDSFIDEDNLIILFATEKINYKLPEEYALFYNRFFKSSKDPDIHLKSTGFAFIPSLIIQPEIVAYPCNAYIDPFSHTCDEWIVIAEDDYSIDNGCGRVFINCNPNGNYFGKLLFYSSSDDGCGYVSSFYFDDFLLILMDKFSKINFPQDSDPERSIVDYFSYFQGFNDYEYFNNNEYFTKRNSAIMNIINKFLCTDLCKIILDYVYYEHRPYESDNGDNHESKSENEDESESES